MSRQDSRATSGRHVSPRRAERVSFTAIDYSYGAMPLSPGYGYSNPYQDYALPAEILFPPAPRAELGPASPLTPPPPPPPPPPPRRTPAWWQCCCHK